MPYTIKRYQDGYRVVSPTGRALSNHALSFAQAKKQKVAVTLSELRSRQGTGGSVYGGDEGYALSDTDIERVLKGIKLFRYPELHSMHSIEDAFDEHGRSIMLYLTENEASGHWVCMIRHPGTKVIEYFDPYGGYSPDGERKWLSKEKLEELGEAEPTLSRMIKEGGYKVVSNPYHFQKESSTINTCGRHCCTRLIFCDMPLKRYAAMIKSSGLSGDDFVTEFVSQLLHK